MPETPVSFTSYDGLVLHGTYQTPDGPTRAALLHLHPITADRGFSTDESNYFAQHGIATLRFDYRCHGVDETPREAFSLGGVVNDITAAFTEMEKLAGDSVPHRYLMGVSFSGGLTAYWAHHHAERLSRLFLWAPVVNYADDMTVEAGDWLTALNQDGVVNYCGFPVGRPFISEMAHVNGIQALRSPKVPVLIFHGDKDDNVPIASSQQYCKPNGDCELFVIKGGGHMLDAPGDDAQTEKNHQSVFAEIVRHINMDVEG